MEYGNFNASGNEFIINEANTPRHWYNYLWNDNYISFVSQVGFGEGFAQDDMGRRINLISNRNLFVCDTAKNEYWTANAMPVNKNYQNYSCTHGIGYTQINLEYPKISSCFRVFVPNDDMCEIWTLTVKNNDSESRELKIIPYFATEIDGAYKPQGYNLCKGFYDSKIEAAIGQSYTGFGGGDIAPAYSYLLGSELSGYDTRKNAFIGTYGTDIAPMAFDKQLGCTNSDCLGEKLCFAVENTVALTPGQEKTLYYIAGVEKNIEKIVQIKQKYILNHTIEDEFLKTVEKFKQQIDDVTISTPDDNFNLLFNSWLKHQTNMGSQWARVRHNGYRDLTSDSECLASFNPLLALERIKRILTYQYSNGYAPRTFLDGTIRDNNFSDNTVWITFAIYAVLKELGDLSILDQTMEFNDKSKGTIYEHVKRSVDFLWNFRGLHNLIKIWGGDWNDCMNCAGLQGKGVSVWLSIAWYRANKQFEEIAMLCGNADDAQTAKERGEEMRELIDQYGWDGEYYLTAYSDDGIKIGSKECEESRIYLIPQLWAVLSGMSKNGKDITAMESVDRLLETPLGTRVSYPPYTKYHSHIGIMSIKPPGVHENGGVYLHPMMWKLAVDCMLKRNDKVQIALEKILPYKHKWSETCGEPYVLYNSYFTEETGYRYGTPGQSWRTASGAWLVKATVNYIFGLKPDMDGIRLEPCLPPDWKICSISKKFRGALYNIKYIQTKDGGCNTIEQILVNNEVYTGSYLPYEKGKVYDVVVSLG